jgi:hypothetical protein
MFKSAKTFVLLAAMSGLLLAIGALLDGGSGQLLPIFLVLAIAMNFFSYFYSDKLAIKMAKAEPMDEARFPRCTPWSASCPRKPASPCRGCTSHPRRSSTRSRPAATRRTRRSASTSGSTRR